MELFLCDERSVQCSFPDFTIPRDHSGVYALSFQIRENISHDFENPKMRLLSDLLMFKK
jgi:hypothetical protein